MPLLNISYSHEALADYILAHPSASNEELGRQFNRGASWISIVKNSDAFKEFIARRREQIVDPVLTATMEERFAAVAQRSLEVLQEKLEAPSSVVPDELALAAAKLGATGMGIGGFAPKGQVAVGKISIDRITVLADRLRALNPSAGETVEMPA